MHGDTYGAGLVGYGAGDGLSDPPCSVCGKLKALGVVEFFDRLDKAKVTLLDKVEEVHTAAQIALGYADDQPEVGLGKTLFGAYVALGDANGELDFLFRSQQRNTADLFEIHLDRVVDRNTVAAVLRLGRR